MSSWLGSFWSAAEDVWLFYQAQRSPLLSPLPGALNDKSELWMHVLLGMQRSPVERALDLAPSESRPRHLRVGLKGNPPFLNEEVFSVAAGPSGWSALRTWMCYSQSQCSVHR